MRKLRILLVAAALAITTLLGVGTALAAGSSGADASGKASTVQQPAPERLDRDCPNKGGTDDLSTQV